MSSKEKSNPKKTKLSREEREERRKERQRERDLKEKERERRQQEKNLNGLLELRRLLVEEDTVTGYYEDCIHKSFARKVKSYPCPWDSRVLNDSDRDVTCGCYYSCTKFDTKIIANKEAYVRAIDNLIANLKENPNWGSSYADRKAIMDDEGKKQIEAWQKKQDEEYAREQEEEEKYQKENKFSLIGCPAEFIKDLKKLNDKRALDLGDDYFFYKDKIIYKFFDWDMFEEEVEINTDNMWFSMYPNKEKTMMTLEIGTGCVVQHHLELNSKNKEKLLNFWSKWKKFKDDNPELYNENEESFSEEFEFDEEKLARFSSDIECEVCLFTDHCDRVFCLK